MPGLEIVILKLAGTAGLGYESCLTQALDPASRFLVLSKQRSGFLVPTNTKQLVFSVSTKNKNPTIMAGTLFLREEWDEVRMYFGQNPQDFDE